MVAAAVVGASTKPHALLLHSHLAHGMDRKTHTWQTLVNLLGGLRCKRFNSDHGDSGPPREGGGSGGGAGGPEPLFGGLRGVSAVLVFRHATSGRFSAAEARLAARLANIAPAPAALHLGANPLHVLVYTQWVLSLVLPAVMAAVRWCWRMVEAAGRAVALAGTVFVTAVCSFVAG